MRADLSYTSIHYRVKEHQGYGVVEYRAPSGELHREDGPARIWESGEKEYFLFGKSYSEALYVRELRVLGIPDDQIEFLGKNAVLQPYKKFVSNMEDDHGVRKWKLPNGRLHRLDGPAVIHPADIRHQYSDEYWIDGEEFSEIQYDAELTRRNLKTKR